MDVLIIMTTIGYVYILTNKSFDRLIKIGQTSRSPEERASELSAPTGVPTPYKVAYQEFVTDCKLVEGRLHNRLSGYRVNSNREFFQLPLKNAIQVLQEVAKDFKIEEKPQSETTPDFQLYRKEIGLLWGTPHPLYVNIPKYSEFVEFEGKFLAEAEERSNKNCTGYELYLLTNGRFVVYKSCNHNLGDWGTAYLAGVNAWGEIDPPLTLVDIQDRFPLLSRAAGLTRIRRFDST